jgi:hypothetical protein
LIGGLMNFEDAEHGYDVTLETLKSLQEVGADVRPVSSIAHIRYQVALNLASLINGERPDRKSLDALSAVLLGESTERAPFAGDSIIEAAFRIMDAFDRREWSVCVAEFLALRDPLLEKFCNGE